MEELIERIVNQLHSIASQSAPMDAYAVMQIVIEEAQIIQDDCLRMEHSLQDSSEDENY